MLHLVQAEEGYVTPQGIAFCAETLGLTFGALAEPVLNTAGRRRLPVVAAA